MRFENFKTALRNFEAEKTDDNTLNMFMVVK